MMNANQGDDEVGGESSVWEVETQIRFEDEGILDFTVRTDMLKATVGQAKTMILQEPEMGNVNANPNDITMTLMMPPAKAGQPGTEQVLDELKIFSEYLDMLTCCDMIQMKRIN